MKKIISERNPLIKKYLKLIRGQSSESNLLPLEGFHLIEEALRSGIGIEQLFYTPEVIKHEKIEELFLKLPSSTEKVAISKELLYKISQTEAPQGILAISAYPHYEPENVLGKSSMLAMLVDQLQDPGNFGTIIRTAAGANFDAVFFTPGTVKYNNPKVLRATAGAIFHIKVLPTGDLKDYCQKLRERSIFLYAAHPQADNSYYEVDYCNPAVILIGNENRGITNELLSVTTKKINIPLNPKLNSLNAGVAAGIIIYEAFRQRMGK